MFKFQHQNGKKRKSGKQFSGLQNGAKRGLKVGAGGILQMEATLGISNWRKKIKNRGSDSKSGQTDFKSGQEGFEIGAGITNWCRTPPGNCFWKNII